MNITVASIEWPKPGKKIGAVIDSTGKRWGVWPDKLPIFQQFATYEITYESNDFKGQTYYTIKTAVLVGGNGMQQSPSLTALVRQGRDANQPDTDNQRRLDIFVAGGFNNMMSNPNVDPKTLSSATMIAFVNALKAAWKATLGPQAQPIERAGALNAELDDRIPF
jgi:hypothetical protein